MKTRLVLGVCILLVMCSTPVLAGEYITDFNEATTAALSPGILALGANTTASIGGSQLTLSNPTVGLNLFQSNKFGVIPQLPATSFVNGVDITVVLDASTIEGMKTTPKAFSGITVIGTSNSPIVVFGACGPLDVAFLSYCLIPSAQWPGGTTQEAQIPAMAIWAMRYGGNRIPWWVPLPDVPADTTLRIVVDGSLPPNATFSVDGVPVWSDYEIGPNKIYVAAAVQQSMCYLGGHSGPITTKLESFRVVGDSVPFYPPPSVEGVITCNLEPGWIEAGMRVVLTAPTGTSYQWKQDGEQMIGETAQTLVFDPVAESLRINRTLQNIPDRPWDPEKIILNAQRMAT